MKIVLAIDSFKGSLSSREAEDAAARGIREIRPDAEIASVPVSDGGECLLAPFIDVYGCKPVTTAVRDPLLRPIRASFCILPDGTTAVIETAMACGLPLLSPGERHPRQTASDGAGDLMAAAAAHGCTELIVGLGGSGTCDGGMGMLRALGARFDAPFMEDVTQTELEDMVFRSRNIHITAAADVRNPLFGPNGAAYVFAPQKGASVEDTAILDRGLRRFAGILSKATGRDCARIPGAGAAGGIGFALMSVFGADIRPGAELLLEMIHFDELIRGCSLVITGEGHADRQTMMGKLPGIVLKHAHRYGIPVMMIAGGIEDEDELRKAGFDICIRTTPRDMPLPAAMDKTNAKCNIRNAIAHYFKKYNSIISLNI